MNPINAYSPLNCPKSGILMNTPVIADCGHTFECTAITSDFYCPIHETTIDKDYLYPDTLAREITFQVLVNRANYDADNQAHRTICLSFTHPSTDSDYSERNMIYEYTKRIGGCDLAHPISLIDPIAHSIIQQPVIGRCGHTFDFQSIPKEGVSCPLDGELLTQDTVSPHLFVSSYIKNLQNEEYIVPREVGGVYLDLKLTITMKELGIIAKRVGAIYKAANVYISDGTNTLDDKKTLGEVLMYTPEKKIPYFFAFAGKGHDFSLLENGY